MRDLTQKEVIEINGGTSEKERSAFDSVVDTLGGAIAGAAGVIASWFK